MHELRWDAVIEAPFGRLGLLHQGGALAEVEFLTDESALRPPRNSRTCATVSQFERYFGNPRHRFDVTLMTAGTPFQERVWQALGAIPCGTTLTYGELARRLGSAARAVGGACRRNPIALVIPCHRVVASTGYGGFAGSRDGSPLAIKRWLLEHEGVRLPNSQLTLEMT